MVKHIAPRNVIRRAFPGIRENEADEMIAVSKICSYPPKSILCHDGAIENTFYIILDGEVEVTKVINDAEIRFLNYLRAGDFFGEMALIHNAPRVANVVTISPTTVLEINKDDFTRLLEHSGSMSLAMVREVSRRLRENDEMAIGDLRLKARELADAYQQLAEQEYARHEFLTTIAHELRTPLTAAGGFLQMVRSGMLKGEQLDQALDTVSRNIKDIVSLVNDILFLQEMDLILPDFQPTDVGAVVKSAVAAQQIRAETTGASLTLAVSSDLPPIPGDPKSLERAVTAVIDNAIKFSPDGGDVRVAVGCDDTHLWIKVQDHGVGIPPEAKPRIFERFFHIDQMGVHLFGGVGLGLSIARQVIELHNGDIEVDSELGKGSTFVIRLKKNSRV